MILSERYRPSAFDQLVGQNSAIRKVQTVLAQGWGGRSWFITGKSGTGKTSLARLIAAVGADEFGTEELDAGKLTPGVIADIERNLNYRAFSGKPGKCWIVNEAHGLRKDSIRLLLTLLEQLPNHCVFIFTSTREGQAGLFEDKIDAAPFVARCTEIALAAGEKTLQAFARRAFDIAKANGMDGVELPHYLKAAVECDGSMRQLLSQVECGKIRSDADKAHKKTSVKPGGAF